MKLYNNTQNDAFYGVSYGNNSECGTIPADKTIDFSRWDNQTNLKVTFVALGKGPPGDNPFSVTIPKSGKHMVVTMGLFQE